MIAGELSDLMQGGRDAPRLAGRLLPNVVEQLFGNGHFGHEEAGKRYGVFEVARLRQTEIQNPVVHPLVGFELLRQKFLADQDHGRLRGFVDVADELDHLAIDELVGLVDDQRTIGSVSHAVDDFIHHRCHRAARTRLPEFFQKRLAKPLLSPVVTNLDIDGARLVHGVLRRDRFPVAAVARKDADPRQTDAAILERLDQHHQRHDVLERGDRASPGRFALDHRQISSHQNILF